MIYKFSEFIKFFGENVISGIFVSVILIILTKLLFKNKIETDISIRIIKWIIIVYSLSSIISILLVLIFQNSELHTFLDRLTGPYWWAYSLMLIMNSIVPLLLLIKKTGRAIYFLLFVAFLMNIGWLFESFVIHVTSIHGDAIIENYNPYLPSPREVTILIKGFLTGFIALLIGNGVKKLSKTGNV